MTARYSREILEELMPELKTKRVKIATNDAGAPLTAVEVLRMLRTDVKEMETHSVDGILVLIPKADVLEMIQDWVEYLLNPEE